MREITSTPNLCADLLETHGSPLNFIDTNSLRRNVDELHSAAAELGVDLFVQVARKANKALAIVDEARDCGFGIDVGSEAELRQVLDRGVAAERIVVTAAIKPRSLLELCLETGALVALDNVSEAAYFAELAAQKGLTPNVALRLQPPADGEHTPSRFGEQQETWLAWLAQNPAVAVVGLHFHLHGYDPLERAAMLRRAMSLIESDILAAHPVKFIDIGGGIPMSYLDDSSEWSAFWQLHQDTLNSPDPLTWRAHPLTNVYPYFQQLVRADWLRKVLKQPAVLPASSQDGEEDGSMAHPQPATMGTHKAKNARTGASSLNTANEPKTPTLADELRERGLQLRCEPGRAVLDGTGLTLARVAFRKTTSDGLNVVGLEMNRTQCRSTSDDFLVDPILVHETDTEPPAEWMDAFLVGAYCIENELILTRRVRVPANIDRGDIVAFPNTGGYLMHILESASHQIPLAKNMSRRSSAAPFALDPIDE